MLYNVSMSIANTVRSQLEKCGITDAAKNYRHILISEHRYSSKTASQAPLLATFLE